MKIIQDHFKKHWPFYILIVLGLYFNFIQLTGLNLERIQGDLGDTRFIMSIVEYNYQWLIGTYSNYWDGFFMVPDKEVISYSDNLLGTLPFYALYRFFGIDYLSAFQLLLLSSHILNFCFTYIFFTRNGAQSVSAAIAAYIFTFSIGLVSLYNHPQYCLRFAIPLFYMMLMNYLQSLSFRYLLFSALALVYQFYLNVYLGYFLFVTGGVYLFSYLCFNLRSVTLLRKYFIDVLKVLPAFLLLYPLFFHYYQRNLISGYYNEYAFYMQTIPRLSSYFKAFEGSYVWQFLLSTNVYSKFPWLHTLFPGLYVIVAILLGILLALRKSKMFMIILLTIILIISFTTYYEGHTLYGYLMKIPGIKAARVVSRIILLLIFFAAWLVSLEIDLLLTKVNGKKLIISLFLIAGVLVDNSFKVKSIKTITQKECTERVNFLEKKHKAASIENKSKVIAFLNADTINCYIHHLDAMLCALKLGKKTINGYSSSCHPKYGEFWRKPNETSLNLWLTTMNVPKDSVLIIK